jgi:hypothetical protein
LLTALTLHKGGFVDLTDIQEIIYFASGIAAALVTAYGTMKAQGKIVYPAQKIEAGRAKVPWKETMIELFSEDWVIIE